MTFGPTHLEDLVIFVDDKFWWAQAEGMKALLTMALRYPNDRMAYAEQFRKLWEYVKRYMIDSKHKGWFWVGVDANRRVAKKPKATMWKDPSHEAGALMDCIRMFGGGAHAPVR